MLAGRGCVLSVTDNYYPSYLVIAVLIQEFNTVRGSNFCNWTVFIDHLLVFEWPRFWFYHAHLATLDIRVMLEHFLNSILKSLPQSMGRPCNGKRVLI